MAGVQALIMTWQLCLDSETMSQASLRAQILRNLHLLQVRSIPKIHMVLLQAKCIVKSHHPAACKRLTVTAIVGKELIIYMSL
jgi:hypothetical protein